jgi:hypothetical protein
MHPILTEILSMRRPIIDTPPITAGDATKDSDVTNIMAAASIALGFCTDDEAPEVVGVATERLRILPFRYFRRDLIAMEHPRRGREL